VLIDSTHVDVDEVLAHAQIVDFGCLIFTHLGDAHEIARLQEKIKRSGVARTLLAEPGMVLQL
jgi:hypothetical protein